MGTTAKKLERLNDTKADLKAALAEKGQTVGNVFSTYPAAVRAISRLGCEKYIGAYTEQNGVFIFKCTWSPRAYIAYKKDAGCYVAAGLSTSTDYHDWFSTYQSSSNIEASTGLITKNGTMITWTIDPDSILASGLQYDIYALF